MGLPRIVWGALIAIPVALDLWAHRNNTDGDTLSEQVRAIYRTDTASGRVALCLSWAALTAWVIPHWCRTPAARLEEF